MEIITILLKGKDMDYCKALTRSISQLSRELLITIAAQADQNGTDFENYDLIVYEGCVQNEFLLKRPGSILLAEDRKDQCKHQEAGFFTLYKYGNVKELIKDILLIFNLVTGKKVTILSDNNCKIVSVYSGFGGAGKTSLSIGLAQEFGRFRDKNTLYVNFEEWDHTEKYFEVQSENRLNSIGDYLYYSSRGRKVNLDSFLGKDGYGTHYFKPVAGRNQLKTLTGEEFSDFINNLIEAEWLEYIIFDCSNCLDENTLWLLKNSYTIVYIFDNRYAADSRVSVENVDPVIQYLKEKTTPGILERMINVANGKEADEIELENQETIFMESDPGSFQSTNGKIQINIERGFGQGIRKLADKIENHQNI